MKTKRFFLLAMLISFGLSTMAQVAINNDGTPPDESAILDLQSTSQGLLLPRLSNTERDGITSPASGLFIFNTDMGTIQFYSFGQWQSLTTESCAPEQPNSITGNAYPDCGATGVSYSIDAVNGAASYDWEMMTNGANIVSGQGTTSITVNMGSESGNVWVSAVNGCGSSDIQQLPITIGIPAQPGSITGNAYPACGAIGVTYSIDAVNGATGYNWTMPNDKVTIQSGHGTTSIVVNIEAGATSGDMLVNSYNTCGTSADFSYAITIGAPAQPGSIAGSSGVPANSSRSYSVEEGFGAVDYLWTVPEGATIIGGVNSRTVTIEFGTESVEISVVVRNNCGNSDPRLMSIIIRDFLCGDQYEDGRDNEIYNTVLIDDQCWFAENLNVGDRIDASTDQTNNSTIEKYCYDDDDANCATYGGFYKWDEMMQYETIEGTKGVCPDGWHLPTFNEWTTLVNFLGGETVAGQVMKSTTGWTGDFDNTNNSGFTGLASGVASSANYYSDLGIFGYWSSSTQAPTDMDMAYRIYLTSYEDVASIGERTKANGYSVRCLKDE
jgi:uncharacterized protein (TIGR02145 family)